MNSRLIELDILRGLSILGMILVITPGDWSQRFSWMNHAEWIGYPLSDMIFPSFLFCVGMSIAISFDRKFKQNIAPKTIIKKIITRTISLFLIGVLINGFPTFNWQNIRIPGVLQRIAICYGLVAFIWLFLKSKKVTLPVKYLLLIALTIGIGYCILLYFIPVPSFGITGHSSVNSWPSYIDQKVFGVQHLWIYGTTDGIVTYDPEGILASFPASINVIIGLVFGQLYIQKSKLFNNKYFIVIGIILMLIGYVLNVTSINPIIKKIWTTSFALFSSGFSLLALAIINIFNTNFSVFKKIFYPFVVYGSNALLAFIIGNAIIPIMDIPISNETSIRQAGFHFFKDLVSSEKWGSFLYGITFLMLLFGILQFLYQKKLFLKL